MVILASRRLITTVALLTLATATMMVTRSQLAAAASPLNLKYAISTSIDSHQGRGMVFFATRVKELTNGQVTIQMFPDAKLASEAQALEGMQTGTIDMGAVTLYAYAVKLGAVFDLPFLFRDFNHWVRTVDGKPGQMVAEAAPAVGLRILGFQSGGWRDVYGSKPMVTLADFKGVKIRCMQIPTFVELFKALGAIPTPMAWPEIYMGLQQKTVDAAETALPAMYDAKHYEVAKFAAPTHHAMSNMAVLVSEQRWKTLSPDVQQALMRAAKEANQFQRQEYLKDAETIVKLLKEKGVTFTTPDNASFQEVTKSQVYPKVVREPEQKALLEEVLKIQ